MLEDSKQAVLEMKATLDAVGVVEQDPALQEAAGRAFYNTSKFTLRGLRSRANRQQLTADFEAYLDTGKRSTSEGQKLTRCTACSRPPSTGDLPWWSTNRTPICATPSRSLYRTREALTGS